MVGYPVSERSRVTETADIHLLVADTDLVVRLETVKGYRKQAEQNAF